MDLTPKTADRFSFGILYVLVASITLWAGFALFNRGFELRFFKDYLVQWEVGINAFTAQQGKWPNFSGTNHVDYMDRLAKQMRSAGITVPASNTAAVYRYRMERFGRRVEDIFVLCLHNRIILYGISEETLGHLDKVVDRHADLLRGRISGRPGKNPNTYIGMWQL
jgi:hypothetical protein